MNLVLLLFVLTTFLTSFVLGRVGPDGYDTIPNSPSPTSSYKLHLEEKTWEEANVICQEEGANLIVIDSEAEANLLYLLRESQEKRQFLVGMHTKGNWDDWITVLGEPIAESVESNWLAGEPTPDEHCGAIQLPDKHYNNVRCNFAKLAFFCEKQPSTNNVVRHPTNLRCIPIGYVTPNISKPTSSYKMHPEGMTWEEANLVCADEGGHLAVIESQVEADFLDQMRRDDDEKDLQGQERLQFYVGVHCKGRWGQWMTVLGEPIAKTVSDNWLQGEPTPDEHCVALQLPDKHYNNVRCNFETMPFFCEKPVVETDMKSALTSAKSKLEPCVLGGYKSFSNNASLTGSYKIHQEIKTWEEANLICLEEGAHLLVVNSQEEAAYVDRLRRTIGAGEYRRYYSSFRSQLPFQYHIGLHCKGHWGYWMDVMGATVKQSGYNRWLLGSPSPDAHCGAIRLPAKRFYNVKCNFEYLPFICEKEPEGAKVIPVPNPNASKNSQPPSCSPIGYVTAPDLDQPGSSYKVHYERRTWEEANLICQEEGGYLLVIDTQVEADMLHLLVKNPEKTQFLVGINCKGRWGEWVTVLGDSIVEPGGFNQWLEGEPTPSEHCGTIQLPDKRYNNVRCNFEKLPFICEKKLVSPIAKPTQTEPCLSPSYVAFPNASTLTSSYKLHKEFLTWEEANLVCEEEASHLVVVNSLEEAENLSALREIGDGDEFHVGMHRKGRWMDDWVTVLGGTVAKSGFDSWRPDQPSSAAHCGGIDLLELHFINVRCNSAYLPFICEKPAPPTPTPTPAPQLPASQCTHDVYETFPGPSDSSDSSYKLHRERVTWDVASFVCQREGAHLVVVNSEVEANFVALLLGRVTVSTPSTDRGYGLVHVGITDRKREGRWRTVLGDSLESTGFTAWRKGKPDNLGGLQHCAAMSSDKLMEDIQCNDLLDVYPFVCEMKN